ENLLDIARDLEYYPARISHRATTGLFSQTGSEAAWLTPAMRQELAELASDRASVTAKPLGMDNGNYSALSDILNTGRGQHNTMRMAAWHGLRVHAPFLDNDVVRACLQLPAYMRKDDPHIFKPLLDRALHGLVPSMVTQRNTKGDYGGTVYDGIRRAAQDIDRLLTDSRLADLGIIDPAAVRISIGQALNGMPIPSGLDALIASELWLRKLDEAPGSSQAPPPNQLGAITLQTAPGRTETKAETLQPQARYCLPDHTHLAPAGKGAMLLNTETGNFHRLSTTGRQILAVLENNAPFEEVVDYLAQIYPTVDKAQLHDDAADYISNLLSEGLLVEGNSSRSSTHDLSVDISRAPRRSIMARPRRERSKLNVGEYAIAVGALASAVTLKHMSVSRRVTLLTLLHEKWCRRTATVEEARRSLEAAETVSGIYPGRIACQELSLTASLAAAIRRRRIDFHIGTATDPNRSHAWIAADGEPIQRADDEPAALYRTIMKL
ncbi:MAG: lasso peptide biosynthesis B2 protein, partial [Patescibacteria group bacterium]